MKTYLSLSLIFLFLALVIYFGSKDVKVALAMVGGAFIGASAVMYAIKNKIIN